jgi:hypothetical protein
MAALLSSLGGLVRTLVGEVLGERPKDAVAGAVADVLHRRRPCAQAAHRQTRAALEDDAGGRPNRPGVEWMSYTALLVQVDRIVEDLRAPLPTPGL